MYTHILVGGGGKQIEGFKGCLSKKEDATQGHMMYLSSAQKH